MERYTIKQARQLAGKTQVGLARELGVSEATYIKLEKGRSIFRMDQAEKFSEIVKLPIDRIIFLNSNYGKTVVDEKREDNELQN